MTQLRIAVIGAGHLGRIHAKLLGSVEGAKLVGISDPITRQQRSRFNRGPTNFCIDRVSDSTRPAVN